MGVGGSLDVGLVRLVQGLALLASSRAMHERSPPGKERIRKGRRLPLGNWTRRLPLQTVLNLLVFPGILL